MRLEGEVSARWRRLGLAAGWSALSAWIPMSILLTNAAQLASGGDFGMYYAAAETLRLSPHGDIYARQTLAATVLRHGGCGVYPLSPYPYQPLLAVLLEPATLMPCLQAAALWSYLNILLWLALAGALSFQAWRRYSAGRALVVAAAILAFTPILSGIHLGQIHLILLLSMVLGTALVEREYEYVGGAMLGIGIMLKYLPMIMVIYYLLRGRWRVALGAGVLTAALTAVEYVVVGPRILIESIGAGQNDVSYYATRSQNGHWMSALPVGLALPYVVGVVFLGTVLWVLRRGERRALNERLGAFWAVNTLLLMFPLAWWFYMTWLIPSFLMTFDAICVVRDTHRGASNGRVRAIIWLALAILLLSYLLMLHPAYDPGAATYRMMALGSVLLWLVSGALFLWSARVRWPASLSAGLGSAGVRSRVLSGEAAGAGPAPE